MAESRVITKQLAGSEDLVKGIGTVTQKRGTGDKTITKLNVSELQGALVVDTMTELEQLNTDNLGDTKTVIVNGKGTYKYNGSSWEAAVGSALFVDSIKDLGAASTKSPVYVKDYHIDTEGGGGLFIWDGNRPKSEHNGGTVIDPNAVFPTDWDNQTQLGIWFDTANVGTGVWVRKYDGAVNVKWFGAKGDGITDDNITIQSAINEGSIIYISEGIYMCLGFIDIGANKKVFGAGRNKTTLRFPDTTNCINPDNYVRIEYLNIDGNSKVSDNGIFSNSCTHLRLKGVRVTGFKYGLKMQKTVYHTVEQCYFELNDYGIYYFGDVGAWNIDWFNNVITIKDTKATGGTIGIYAKACELRVSNIDTSSNTTGIQLIGDSTSNPAHGITIDTIYNEGTNTPFKFSFAEVSIDGWFAQGGGSYPTSSFNAIMVAENSSKISFVNGRDIDYWDYRFRLNDSYIYIDTLPGGAGGDKQELLNGAKIFYNSYTDIHNTHPVVESGSNANGTYTKFKDGTMICQMVIDTIDNGSDSTSYTYTWNFPATFSEKPSCSSSASGKNSANALVDIVASQRGNGDSQIVLSTDNVVFKYVDNQYLSFRFLYNIQLLAIGRWL